MGLTQCDIDAAVELVKSTQSNLSVPPVTTKPAAKMPIHPVTKKPASGYNSPAEGIVLNGGKYLGNLDDNTALNLLEAIIHESIHDTLPYDDPRQNDISGTGYPYSEAKRRLTDELKKKYLKDRKKKCCN